MLSRREALDALRHRVWHAGADRSVGRQRTVGLGARPPLASRLSKPDDSAASAFPGKAKHVIHLFMNGGPSQVDTFDPKPSLQKYAGKALPSGNLRTERKTGAALPSPFKFQKYGESGIEVSELFAQDGRAHRRHLRHPLDARRRAEPRAVADADELRRRAAAAAEHGLVGHLRPGHREPEPARLHRHVPRRLSDRGDRRTGSRPSCPASTRAPTSTRQHTDIEKLIENIQQRSRRRAEQQRGSSTCSSSSTTAPASSASTTPQLEARIQSFELAYRMQIEATDAFDVDAGAEARSATCTAPACRPGRC